MLSFAFYLLKVILSSAVLFAYYWFFLRNKVFHSYNRFYLLVIVLLSLTLPLMRINVWHKADESQTNVIKILQVVNSSDEYMDEVILYSHYNTVSKEQVFSALYLSICTVFFFLTVQVLFKIRRLVRKGPVTIVEHIHFIKTAAEGTPFSFFGFIFWNDAIDIDSKSGRQVFKHEVAHVQEKHSYDKLFINMILIFFWCNPVFWLIRKELNMIHEFIADKKAVEDGDTADFAAMILQATYPQYRFPLANNFFYSPIKRRLLMLTKQNKTKMNYISRLLVLPLAILVFAAFTLKAKTYIDGNPGIKGKMITVVIDAGHGGSDKGAGSADNIYEKDITLAFAKRIKELNKSDNIKIILTREADIFQTPQQKAALAKEKGADLFISIHIDGAPESSKNMRTGMSVYVAKDKYENSEASKLLASAVIANFLQNYGLAVMANPQQRGGIQVLQANTFPSILIEAGCINNPTDLAYLRTDKAVETFARDILKAIESYSNTSLLNNNATIPAVASSSISFSTDVKNTDSLYLKSNEFKTRSLIIIDSKEIGNLGYDHIEKNILLYDDIVIYSPSKAIKIYADKGRYGAIKLATKKTVTNEKPTQGAIEHDFYFTSFKNPGSSLNDKSWIWEENSFAAETRPLFILNGKEVAGIKGFNVSNDNISDLRLLTPKTAMPTYGDKAKNGVIIINTTKAVMPQNSLIVLDGKIYDHKTWDQVMSENGYRSIEKLEVLEKEEAIKKYGMVGKNGAIIASTRPGTVPDPTYTLSGISGPRIHISQLKKIKEVQLTSPEFELGYATVYFSGKGFPGVVMAQLKGGSLEPLQKYLSRVVAGTNVTFDNVKIQKKGSGAVMEINGRGFSFYDESDPNSIYHDKIFTKVEIEPDFPGGKTAWQEYLRKNINAGMPIDEGWKPGTYTILVEFIVDKDGYVSDVKTGDRATSKTAIQCVELIKNGPRWIPAKQNGDVVKAYKKQPITFVVSAD
ncbi:MAG: N-acetylmuramoyl-L-alanine amidase [Ferruginibacter sp.]